MPITYSIAIDRNDDGDYTDLPSAIESDVLAVRWRLGMARRYDALSAPALAEITMRNRTGTYSPELNTLLPAKRIRIQSNDGTTTRTHFVGEISKIEPLAGEYSVQTSIIHAQGREVEMVQNKVRLPQMLDVRADEVLDEVFDRLVLRYPVLDGYCIIDYAGYNTIDSVSIFPADAVTRSFDTGKSTFAYVGASWSDGISADEAMREVLYSEGGRFFFNRDGDAVFYNRHHLLENVATDATFTDDMNGLAYEYGADKISQVNVRLRLRYIGADNSQIWSLVEPLRILRGQSATIIARYEIDDEPVALTSRLAMQYSVRLGVLETSADVSELVYIGIMNEGFTSAEIEIRNTAPHDVYLHQLDLYGTPLIRGDLMTLIESDTLARVVYGLRIHEIDFATLSDVEEAIAVATYELKRRSNPQGKISSLRTSTRTHPTQTLALTLFDRIKIVESQTGHTGFYRIVAETHEVDKGGTRHCVNWLLEPDDSEIFFVVDTHDVNGDEVLLPR